MRTEPLPPRALPESCPLLKDRNAAGEWVPCCSQYFYRLASRIVGDDGLAEDALQDSWPKVLRATHGFQGGPTACHWVRTIVANSAKDIRRKRLRASARATSRRRSGKPLPRTPQRGRTTNRCCAR